MRAPFCNERCEGVVFNNKETSLPSRFHNVTPTFSRHGYARWILERWTKKQKFCAGLFRAQMNCTRVDAVLIDRKRNYLMISKAE